MARTEHDAEKVDNCHAVKLVFGTLCSSELFLPLKLEIFLIAAKVLNLLIADADHATVEAEVLNHEGFDRFIYHVASCAEPFVHAATLRLCTVICQLPGADGLRNLLRSKLVKVLQSPLSEPAFVLELILLSLTQEEPEAKAAAGSSDVAWQGPSFDAVPPDSSPLQLSKSGAPGSLLEGIAT